MQDARQGLNVAGVFSRLAANPFVGRQAPVEAARAAFEMAQQGRGQSLLVFGESGIGKTRLADEMIGVSQSMGIRPIAARCHELDGAPALWPWIQLVRPLLATLDEEERHLFLDSIGSPLVRLIPELTSKTSADAGAIDAVSTLDRYAVFEAMTHLVSLCAHATPLFIIIDDLHWADPASILLARYALRELRRDPVVFLGLYRDTDVDAGSPLAESLLDLQKESDSFQMQGLDESEIAKLVQHVAGFEVSPVFLAALEAQTGGNPLFMVEILRMLANEDKLGSPESPSPEPTPLPQSVRHTLERRLDLLSSSTLNTLHRAGILGREFDREVLEFALSRRRPSEDPSEEASEVSAHLGEVLTARLIERVPDQPARYRFTHDLVRETLAAMLSDAERVQLHRHASAALLATRSSRLEEHYVSLARHAMEALLRGARGEAFVSSAREAHHYSLLAARRATSSFSFELGVQLYRQALRALDFRWAEDERADGEVADTDPADAARGGSISEGETRALLHERGVILVEMGDALWQSGAAEEAAKIDREAEKIARRLGDPELLARAAIGLSGRNDLPLDPSEEEARLLVEALEVISDEVSHLRVRLLAHLVRATSFGAHRARLTEWASEAIAMAEELDDPAALFAARESLHYALLMPERLEERLEVSEGLPGLAQRAGSLRLEAIGWLWRVFDLLQVPDSAATEAAVTRLESSTVRLRQPFWRWLALGVRGCLAQMEGDLEEAERLIFKALEVGHRASARNAMTFFGTQLFHLRAEQRRSDELLPVMKKIVADNPGLVVFRIGVPLIHALEGREEEARRSFDEVAANRFEDVPVDIHRLPMLTSCAAVAAFLGDGPRAEMLLDALRPDEGRVIMAGVVTYWGGSVDRSLGQLEETLGLRNDALRHYAAAAAVAAKAGARLQEAHALVDQSRVLRAGGSPEAEREASALENRARLIYEERGIHDPVRLVPRIAAPGESRPFADQETALDSADPTVQSPAFPSRFARGRRSWELSFQGKTVQLTESKGLLYLHCLVSRPDIPVHVLELVALEQAVLSAGEVGGMEQDGPPSTSGSARFLQTGLDAIDPQAMQAYRARLRELSAERASAEADRDLSRLAAIDAESAEIAAELNSAIGLGGRVRQTGSAAERARKAVYNRIRAAIKRISEEHSALGKHLDRSVTTGSSCTYQPEAKVDWDVIA